MSDHSERATSTSAATIQRQPRSVRAVQCRRDNAGEVDAFLAAFVPRRYYRPNHHGGWQGIYGDGRLDQQVWIDSWLVEIPETRTFVSMTEAALRGLYSEGVWVTDGT